MYAVIKSGGKQYRVAEGQTLKLETISLEPGSTHEFQEVLMVVNGDNIQVGKPLLSQAKVVATVLDHGRHKKIKIVKFRRRKHYRRQTGHRQNYTEVKIEKISA